MHLLSHLGSLAAALGLALGVLYSFALLGRAVRLSLPHIEWSSPVEALWDMYLGTVAGAGLTTILGMAGLFNPLMFASVLAAGPIIQLSNGGGWTVHWRALYETVCSLREQPLLALALFVAALIGIVPAASPEIFYDALYYHLGLPLQYLILGEIRWIPGVIHSAFPASLDVLFGLCLGLGGAPAAKFFNFFLFILGWCATAAFVQEVTGDRRAAIVGAVAIGTVPGVLIMSTMCGIDASLIGFASMAGLAIARMGRKKQDEAFRLAVLAAIVSGFVAGSKYTGLWLVGAFALSIIVTAGWRRTVMPVLSFIGTATLVAAPWYLRNLIVIGDPIYPVLNALAGDPDAMWTIERIRRDVPAAGVSWSSLTDLATGLIDNPGRFGAGAEPGVLIPLGLVAIAVGALRSPSLRPWAVAAAAYFVVWLSQSSVLRYLYPVYPLCALGLAWVVARTWEHCRPPAVMAVILAVLALAPLSKSVKVLDMLYNGADVAALFAGSLSNDEYLARRLPYYPAAQWLNSHTPPDAHIYYLGETRLLYLTRQVSFTSAYDHHEMSRLVAAESIPLFDQLKSRGVTHIVVNGREIERLRGAYDYLDLSADVEQRVRAALSECPVVFVKSGVQVCELPH